MKADNSCQLNVLQSGDSNWFKDRTCAENRELQQKDRNLAMLIDWKERNIQPTWAEISKFNHELKSLWAQWDRINLIDGVLYRQWFESGTKTSIQQVLVPLSQRKEMFNSLHESNSSGHLGIKIVCLFGVLRCFQHCTGHIMTGSWKGRGNQYIEFARVVYCKLPTNSKQLLVSRRQ